MESIEGIFGNYFIALNATSNRQRWPPRSPELTYCDFYLWEALKESVYETLVRDLK